MLPKQDLTEVEGGRHGDQLASRGNGRACSLPHLAAPDQSTQPGRRDHLLLLVALQTGLLVAGLLAFLENL
ncbi:hypothetical protein ACFFMN_31340 [Planobispora siamensis]|uniref:Uncharacterized protein n=1 Tax=Planobispora siamensis TaxID=936338 RepID=A0A8J3SHV7_9ACTN|nr:hypothetical protein [Planobispora siamensis]GIH92871.1 hypothetical protein Psi01_35010 [Planobispora siamensis]